MEKVNIGSGYNAAQAEDYCKTNFGSEWQLYVPHSSGDLAYGWELAHSGADQSNDYLRILGIYPKAQGNRCTYTAFTSETCTGWRASDDGKFWVGTKTSISEPNGDNCVTGSMYYGWNSDGTINWYNDINCPGYTSSRFICQKGQINSGSTATVKIYDTLSSGTHEIVFCTSTMCSKGYIMIV